jgi:hypothetical protein
MRDLAELAMPLELVLDALTPSVRVGVDRAHDATSAGATIRRVHSTDRPAAAAIGRNG